MRAVKSSGNVFADIGFDAEEAAELAVKSDLITLLVRAMRQRKLSQIEAAALCGTDQPTLSKLTNGKLKSVTIDQLTKWLVALGSTVRINVTPPPKRPARRKGEMRVYSD
jgi:predicted XRE-type DNA-binding protein